MRLPVRAITGHLVWARDGSVWAVYRIRPLPYTYLSNREKLGAHGQLRGAFMALPRESVLLSVCRVTDPRTILERIQKGVDSYQHPAWAWLSELFFDHLLDRELYERHYYISLKLPEPDRDIRNLLRTALASVTENLTPAGPIPVRDIETRTRVAANLEAQIGANLPMTPATPGELRWLYARATRRGILEPYLDDTWEPRNRTVSTGKGPAVAGPTLAHLGDAILKEGGMATDPDRPRHRRYLRVENDLGVGYQTYMVIAEMPRQFLFPDGGGEWFDHFNAFGFPIDWCVRINSVPNQIAQAKARRQARELLSQVREYESEPSGPPSSLADASEGVDMQRSELSSNPTAPELQASIVVSVAADSLDTLEARASQIQAIFQPNEYALPRPTGGQAQLALGMLPGSPTPVVAKDYIQYLLPGDLAGGMPFTGTEVGDPHGMLLGHTVDGGSLNPVLFDPAYGPTINRSGSVGIFGALGSGKSQTAKYMAYGALARGYQVVIVDRTVMGEYVRFSGVTPGSAQVVRLDADAQLTLDPMRVFKGAERTQRTISFLTLLTGTSPTDLEGMALAKAVREAAERPSAGITSVIDALAARASDPDARTVLRKIEGFAEGELSHLIFGKGQAITLEADCVVFHTPGLNLPSKHQLESEYLAKRMLPEQVFSQALLYLVAAVSRSVIFARRDRFGIQLLDEASFLLASPQGLELVLEGIRDGRKHNAALWILSQHPNDMIDERLADLLGIKLVFRQSRGAAGAALRFLEMDASEEETVELVVNGLATGACLMRDVHGRVGMVQVLDAPTAELREAFSTSPTAPAAKSGVIPRAVRSRQPEPSPKPAAKPAKAVEAAPRGLSSSRLMATGTDGRRPARRPESP